MILLFKSEADHIRITQDIAVTPGGIALHASQPKPDYGFDSSPNIINREINPDGRVLVAYPFSVEDEVWLELYLTDEIIAWNVSLYETVPDIWQYPDPEVPPPGEYPGGEL